MHRDLLVLPLVLAFAILAPAPARSNTTYDLTADWSDVANPNGPWAYQEGANVLPHVASWQGLSGDFTSAQPAWARFDVGTSNLPTWFRSSANVGITHDWQTGDVLCHSTDPVNGVGSGPANVTWTSPVAGTIAISGAIWMGRDIGRGNHWSISRNGTELTAGDVFSGDPYDRAAPMDFSAGNGGPSALSSLLVAAGDVIALTVTRSSSFGDYAAMRMQVEYLAPTGVSDVGSSPRASLLPPRPDPVFASTILHFTLPRRERATLAVHNLAGRRVALLTSGWGNAGPHEATWDAQVPAGIYFVVLRTADQTLARRIVVVHG